MNGKGENFDSINELLRKIRNVNKETQMPLTVRAELTSGMTPRQQNEAALQAFVEALAKAVAARSARMRAGDEVILDQSVEDRYVLTIKPMQRG